MVDTATLTPICPIGGPICTHNADQLSPPQSSPDILLVEVQAAMPRSTEQKASRGQGRHSKGPQLDGKELNHKHSLKRKGEELSTVDDASSAEGSDQRRKKRREEELEV